MNEIKILRLFDIISAIDAMNIRMFLDGRHDFVADGNEFFVQELGDFNGFEACGFAEADGDFAESDGRESRVFDGRGSDAVEKRAVSVFQAWRDVFCILFRFGRFRLRRLRFGGTDIFREEKILS